jgi:hypothetical protein
MQHPIYIIITVNDLYLNFFVTRLDIAKEWIKIEKKMIYNLLMKLNCGLGPITVFDS